MMKELVRSLFSGVRRIPFVANGMQAALSGLYVATGMKPWTLGYWGYKSKLIKEYIHNGTFSLENWPLKYGYRVDERVIELPWVFSRLNEKVETVLDGGSALNYDYLIERLLRMKKKLFISTLAPESWNACEKGVSYTYEDLREVCYRDDYFDVIVSLSTIEHVGLDNTKLYTVDSSKNENKGDYLAAVAEYKRILKPGGRLLLTFPFGARKNHGWYQVFDKVMVDGLVNSFAASAERVLYFKYHKDGWMASTAEECANAATFDIHTMKAYEEDYLAFSRSVCCVELVK